jgi:CRISPR-associated endonuclease Cas2
MPRPRRIEISLAERISRMRRSAVTRAVAKPKETGDDLAPLPSRIRSILGIVQSSSTQATHMNYLVMYDITDHKVRALVAKYLKSKGCIRIQKSVFMANSSHSTFNEIHETLKEVNAEYENEDSIMLVPVNVADVRSMKLVGRNVSVDILTDPPSTLFF